MGLYTNIFCFISQEFSPSVTGILRSVTETQPTMWALAQSSLLTTHTRVHSQEVKTAPTKMTQKDSSSLTLGESVPCNIKKSFYDDYHGHVNDWKIKPH